MGSNVDEITCSSWERIGSKGQVVGQLTQRTLETSLSVRGEREEKSGMCVGGSWLWVSGVENWLLVVATLSV